MIFPILLSDEHFVAINKPPGILMHRTRISEDTVFVVQLLRDQLGQRVYPVHRLDRATSGVLIFGKNPESAGLLGEQVMDKSVEKKYLVVVRGWTPENGTIDYALDDPDSGKGRLPAVTHFSRIGTSEIDAPIGLRYKTARFSLVEARLETGRRHQIRKHFAHLNYPVIGDKRHGDVKQNTYFREVFSMTRMLLHASEMTFRHPYSGAETYIQAPVDEEFVRALSITNLLAHLPGQLLGAEVI
ncbi:MAG: tRNA pseudouridine(65) synthase TruC [Saprospiraceae bacterium]